MSAEKADVRFRMVKERHRGTFETALNEGNVDRQLVALCKYLAKTKNYFTSSGCAGRIVLLGLPESGTKKEAYFHRKWHREVEVREVKDALNEKSVGEIWFKQEPFILHIGAGSFKDAEKILGVMRETGVRRGGIIVSKDGKFIVELVGAERMSVPVKNEGDVLISETHLAYLVERANKKLMRNYKLLTEFEANVRKKLG